jgi:hypothetical protein
MNQKSATFTRWRGHCLRNVRNEAKSLEAIYIRKAAKKLQHTTLDYAKRITL